MSVIEEVIWGDVLFAIDFSMDYLCLYFCLRLLRQPIHVRYLCIGAAIGAAAGVVNIAYQNCFTGIWGVVFIGGTAFLCCFFALFESRRKALCIFAMVPLFFLLEAALGGVMTTIYLWLGRTLSTQKTAIGKPNVELPLFLIIFLFSLILFTFTRRVISTKRGQEEIGENVKLLVKHNGQDVSFSCFFDSGNLAREPISGEAVIVLPKYAINALRLNDAALSKGQIAGSRLIPIQTVTGNALLWGIFLKEAYLHKDQRMQRISAYAVFLDGGKENTAILPKSEHFLTLGF